MRIGVPKEIKKHEYRVGLTPGAVSKYVAEGHELFVETNDEITEMVYEIYKIDIETYGYEYAE